MRNNIETEVVQTIRYFSFFNYPPTFTEIHTFLKKKCPKTRLASILEKMTKENLIIQSESSHYIDSRLHGNDKENNLYTLPQYSKYFRNRSLRQQISKKKLQKIQLFLKILSYFPQIQLIGLSGTVTMMNAEEKDDIDLFIITDRNRLFTGRFIALFLAELLGLRRRRDVTRYTLHVTHFKDKVCLNLFFDESNLRVPKFKQTEYVAHEVLQMKPLINKDNTYQRFLAANSWVFKIFPNAREIFNSQFSIFNQNSIFNFQSFKFVGNILENILKKLQLTIIKQHQTNEIITNTQLWFFPEDFEHKLYGLQRN